MGQKVISIFIHWPEGSPYTEYRHNIWYETDEEAAKLVAQLLTLHEALQLLYDGSAREIRRKGVKADREEMRKEHQEE